MMKSTTIRMDDDLKKEASAKLEALGLNFNTYVVMATKQLVAQNRIRLTSSFPTPGRRARTSGKRHARKPAPSGNTGRERIAVQGWFKCGFPGCSIVTKTQSISVGTGSSTGEAPAS